MAPPTGKKASLAMAKTVPVFLVLIVAYASYVVVGPLSVDYLLNPPENVPPRIAAGIAIPIVWVFLLCPVAISWLRLLFVVFRDPGYLPLGEEKNRHEPPQEIWMRDVFVCDQRGLPIYCQHCHNWKPDRAHHSQDAGRCTLKMDHFCPWVGGVVGERSLKFFIQFLGWSLLLSTYAMVLMAYFVHETRSNVQWIITLAFGGFFALFTLGMILNSVWMVFLNITTIENIDRTSRTMLLAVLLPPDLQMSHGRMDHLKPPTSAGRSPPRSCGNESEMPLTSEIDHPSHSSYFSYVDSSRPMRRLARSPYWKGTVTYPLSPDTNRPPLPAPVTRTFAILETPPGMNPWDLGTPWRNFTAVFGHHFHQWFMPNRHSPCCDHSSGISFYPLGPDFEWLLEDVGLMQSSLHQPEKARSSRSGGKRKRKLDKGWRNGERPDGWWSMKEARRQDRLARRPP